MSSTTSPSSSSIPRPSPSNAVSTLKNVHWDPTVNGWVFDNGWQRSFSGQSLARDGYQTFTVTTFPEIREQPAYFKKEYKPSDEMSYPELRDYIADLRQSGFDTIALRVQLDNKLATPVITLVMAVLAVPFALLMGKRGGLAGIATAIGVAIAYYSVAAAIFTLHGQRQYLPPHARGLGARPPLRHRRHLPPPPHPHLTPKHIQVTLRRVPHS